MNLRCINDVEVCWVSIIACATSLKIGSVSVILSECLGCLGVPVFNDKDLPSVR